MLICCYIKSFWRAASCGEARARRRKEDKWAGLALPGMWSDGAVSPPVCGHRSVPARGVVPERCHASGAAVDARRDTPAWVWRAECEADGSVVDIPRALSVVPGSPWIIAQHVARFYSYPTHNCLSSKTLPRAGSRSTDSDKNVEHRVRVNVLHHPMRIQVLHSIISSE